MKYPLFVLLCLGCVLGSGFIFMALIVAQNIMQQATYAIMALAVSFIPFALFTGVAMLSGGRDRASVPNMPQPAPAPRALNE